MKNSNDAAIERAPNDANAEIDPHDQSTVVPISALAEGVQQVRISELPPPSESAEKRSRLVDNFFEGMLTVRADHAHLALGDAAPHLRYLIGGVWQSPRELPTGMARRLDGELRRMVTEAGGATVRVAILGQGVQTFRVHFIEDRGIVIVSYVPPTPGRLAIIDSRASCRRRDLLEVAAEHLEAGDVDAAREQLDAALELAGAIEAYERIEVTVALAYCDELQQRFIAAEALYKNALRYIATSYGRFDLKCYDVYIALSCCARARGDDAVADMWHGRAKAYPEYFLVE